MNEEEEVLQWLITQKTEDRIELITRQMLESMVEDTQYLAVYFCKLIEIPKFIYFYGKKSCEKKIDFALEVKKEPNPYTFFEKKITILQNSVPSHTHICQLSLHLLN